VCATTTPSRAEEIIACLFINERILELFVEALEIYFLFISACELVSSGKKDDDVSLMLFRKRKKNFFIPVSHGCIKKHLSLYQSEEVFDIRTSSLSLQMGVVLLRFFNVRLS
jgi:hypothetical protein